jgi:hypothetical protein
MPKYLQNAIWMMDPFVCLWIVFMLRRRSLVREYPFFFAFAIFQIFDFVIMYTAHHISYKVYFWTYWPLLPVEALFGLGMIYEIYNRCFRPFETLSAFSTSLFKWAVALLILGALVAAYLNVGSEADRAMHGFFILARSTGVVQIGLILLILALKRIGGLHWPRLDNALALGLGISSAGYAIGMTMRIYEGRTFDAWISAVLQISYTLAVVIWAVAITRAPRPDEVSLVEDRGLLRKWNRTLQGLGSQR